MRGQGWWAGRPREGSEGSGSDRWVWWTFWLIVVALLIAVAIKAL